MRESCGTKGSGGLFPQVNMVAEAPTNGPTTWPPPFPRITQDSFSAYGSHVALYAIWHHGSCPPKLSCGWVAGTLWERGVQHPIHSFPKFVYWGSARKLFRRQTPPAAVLKPYFLLREEMGLSKPTTMSHFWKTVGCSGCFFCCWA